jgi:cytochrome c
MRQSYWLALFICLVISPAAFAQSTTPNRGAAEINKGRRLFVQCQACHSLEAGGAHKLGPNLSGIVGTRAGVQPNYTYSAALLRSGIIWNDQTLDRWLERTNATVPGTKMIFAGMPNPADRAALIDYLKRNPRPNR